VIHLRHLETDIIASCQLSCVNCNAFVPLQRAIAGDLLAQPAALAHDLERLGRVAHAERYALIGGEPTLHPDLKEMLAVARASGIADSIEVWSNGLRVASMPPWFWKGLDRLVVSAYPGKITDEKLAAIGAKCTEAGVVFELKDERKRPRWVRLLEAAPTDDATTQRKYDRCKNRRYSSVVDRGHFFRCCTSPFIPRLLQGRPDGSDGIALEGLTEQGLAAFLGRREAMEACRLCTAFDKGRPSPWREEREPVAWLRESSGGAA